MIYVYEPHTLTHDTYISHTYTCSTTATAFEHGVCARKTNMGIPKP